MAGNAALGRVPAPGTTSSSGAAGEGAGAAASRPRASAHAASAMVQPPTPLKDLWRKGSARALETHMDRVREGLHWENRRSATCDPYRVVSPEDRSPSIAAAVPFERCASSVGNSTRCCWKTWPEAVPLTPYSPAVLSPGPHAPRTLLPCCATAAWSRR